MKRTTRITLGSFLLVLGGVGLIIPVLQGWAFLLAGCYVLSPEVPFLQRMQERFKTRFPAAAEGAQRARDRVIGMASRLARKPGQGEEESPGADPGADRPPSQENADPAASAANPGPDRP